MKESQFRLLDTDPNVTEDSTFGTTWRDCWDWQCPSNMKVLLRKGDRFSLYAEYTGPTEFSDPDAYIKIEVRDPSGQKKILIYGPSIYTSSTDFADVSKMAKLNLDAPIVVNPRDRIIFMTKYTTAMDATSIANSYCRLITTKVVELEGGKL